MITQEIWIALVFLDAALTVWFFLDIKNYFSNLICAAMCYLLSTGLSSMMTSGIDNAGTVVTDAWIASVLGWHALLMLFLCGAALLRNTVLSNEKPSRGTKRP